MPAAPHRIETSRLVLRAPRVTDAEAAFSRYAGDADVTRYLGWPRHASVDDTRAFMAFAEHEWSTNGIGAYLILSRGDGRLLGSTGLSLISDSEGLTGYVLARDSWGAGYATEALRAMVDVGRALELDRILAYCHPEHRPSWHVLEKCGFVRDRDWHEEVEFPNLEPGVTQAVLRYVLHPGATTGTGSGPA